MFWHKNKYKIFLIVLLLATFASGIYYDKNSLPENVSVPDEINSLPKLEFKNLEGTKISTEQFKDKIVLVNFWASWCAPCKKEFPSMLKLLDLMKGEVVLIAISNDIELKAINNFIVQYKQKNKSEFKSPYLHIVHDASGDITSGVFNISMFPETLIISPDGNIARKVIGGDEDWSGSEMVKYLKELR